MSAAVAAQAEDIRDAFFDRVYELGRRDRDLVFLTDDMDAFSLRRFKEELPGQFVNIGVAEQHMINLAAGLASCGKRVFAYGITSFVTMRCFEQIKVNLCSMRLPVTLVGVGAGFAFGFDGPTHHGTQDVAIMRALPEMTIYSPSDVAMASACADLAYASGGPVYIRLDKGALPALGREEDDFSAGFRVLRPLRQTNFVATGLMTQHAVQAADELARRGVAVGVVDLYRLKPLAQGFALQVLGSSQRLITVEEHSLIGGLGSLLAEQAADLELSVRIRRIGVPDRQFLEYGSRGWFLKANRLDVESLVQAALEQR